MYNANSRQEKRRVCGKVCFDKRTAQTKMNQLLRLGRERYLRIYNCMECNAWHLTKLDPKGVRFKKIKGKQDYKGNLINNYENKIQSMVIINN